MAMNKEKIEALVKYLAENEERANALMSISAEEACEKINVEGYDFTAEELAEFAQGVADASEMKNEELGEEELDHVAGGVLFSTLCAAALIAYGISAAAGVAKAWLKSRR